MSQAIGLPCKCQAWLFSVVLSPKLIRIIIKLGASARRFMQRWLFVIRALTRQEGKVSSYSVGSQARLIELFSIINLTQHPRRLLRSIITLFVFILSFHWRWTAGGDARGIWLSSQINKCFVFIKPDFAAVAGDVSEVITTKNSGNIIKTY